MSDQHAHLNVHSWKLKRSPENWLKSKRFAKNTSPNEMDVFANHDSGTSKKTVASMRQVLPRTQRYHFDKKKPGASWKRPLRWTGPISFFPVKQLIAAGLTGTLSILPQQQSLTKSLHGHSERQGKVLPLILDCHNKTECCGCRLRVPHKPDAKCASDLMTRRGVFGSWLWHDVSAQVANWPKVWASRSMCFPLVLRRVTVRIAFGNSSPLSQPHGPSGTMKALTARPGCIRLENQGIWISLAAKLLATVTQALYTSFGSIQIQSFTEKEMSDQHAHLNVHSWKLKRSPENWLKSKRFAKNTSPNEMDVFANHDSGTSKKTVASMRQVLPRTQRYHFDKKKPGASWKRPLRWTGPISFFPVKQLIAAGLTGTLSILPQQQSLTKSLHVARNDAFEKFGPAPSLSSLLQREYI